MLEVHTAYQCALILRDLINPYLLRRQKQHVKIALPEKKEQVLFCQLTERQKELYKTFLGSKECGLIYSGLYSNAFLIFVV